MLEERVDLDLVHLGDLVRVREELLEMRHQVVRHADVLRAAVRLQLLERAPGLAAAPLDRPMDQVEVDVLEAEPLHARIEGAERRVVAVIVVPQLRRDEHLAARKAARAEALADVDLVAVDARRVDVAVPAGEGGADGLPGRGAARRLPHAEADDGDGAAAPEGEGGGADVRGRVRH